MPTTIVLLHGGAVNGRMWDPAREVLDSEFTVFTPDLPGHGKERHEPFSFEQAVAETAALIAREAPGGAVVAGDSLGGYVAMALAAAHPTLVDGLVVGGCTGVYGWIMRVVAIVGYAVARPGGHDRMRAKIGKHMEELYPDAPLEAIMAGGVRPEAHKEAVVELAGRRFAEGLSGFGKPILVVNGELDRLMRQGEAAFLRILPDARLAVLDRSPHGVSLRDPEWFATLVRDFARDRRSTP